MTKGKLIIFEGGEATGTTTHSRLLHEFLVEKNIPSFLTREPGGTSLGRILRKVVLHKKLKIPPALELGIYEIDRFFQYRTIVKPNLEKSVHILSDRSWPSTEVYQGFAGDVNIDLIRQLNKVATHGIRPDLLFIIDGDPEKLLEKETDADRFSAKGLKYHQKVRKGYLEILKRYPEFAIKIDYKENDIQEMQNEIRDCVKERLKIF